MRIDPLIAGPAVSVLIAGVIGVGAMTGLLPSGLSPKQGDARPADPGSQSVPAASCALCGTVESIRTIEVRDEPRDVGTVAGGLSGAAAGNRADGGNGNAATTILGTVAGAITGDETERNVKKRYAYRVTVRMDDGSFRTVSLSSPPTLAVGDKVRVVEGKLVRT
ncbi:MAG TPA: glycine zipper 2TM domain-containing protein [Burkholderiales bacterium]|jgi:outer membrane lipoprotein SlyB|nr:glycine zipper 2TM domain-containing protein [Burkholderiales bacterium]